MCTRLLLLLCFSFALTLTINAQDIFNAKDLSKVKVDQVSDADINRLLQQLKQASISIAQAEQMAAAKGMPQGEISKLRQRLSSLDGNNTGKKTETDPQSNTRETVTSDYVTSTKAETQTTPVFGAQLFNTTSLSFEPNLRIATPADYQIGPDDELVLNIFGVQEASYRLSVQPEGTISVPNVGVITVAGLSIDEAKKLIRDRLVKTVYRSIASGATNFTLTLGNIRSIRITVIGASKPGNYTVSSFTTLFNALYLCGGPDKIGSFRSIELIRNNKVYLKADLYQFLLKGDTRQNILLKEGDLINIPVYQKRVTVQGEVKRPGLYELLELEPAVQLIEYAGGFTEKAYKANIKVNQFTNRERHIKDLSLNAFHQYIPAKGDSIAVEPILEKYENRITISGALFRPGSYEWTEGMKLADLIQKAEGLREDAYLKRVLVHRLKPNLTKELIAFSLENMDNRSAQHIVLEKNDSVIISSVSDLKDERSVTISGEVRKPGSFVFRNGYTLKDLILESGGFTDAATAFRVEIARRIVDSTVSTNVSERIAEVINIDIERELDMRGSQFVLAPFDLVTVRRNPGYITQKQVMVGGEVLYPGNYTIRSKQDRISDLLVRSGGFTPSAYKEAVSLIRKTRLSKIQEEEKAKSIANDLADSVDYRRVNELLDSTVKIAINIDEIMNNPASHENLYLEEGDLLEVPKRDLLVKISGEVYSPTKTTFDEGRSLNYYLGRAGGVTDKARKGSIYVVYANGQIAKTEKYLFGLIKNYPRIRTGADIIVPAKAIKTRASTGEIIGIAGVLISMAGVAISIMNTLK